MNVPILSPLLISVISAIQVLGPATLWAAEERGVRIDERRRMVIAALEGVPLTVQKGMEIRAGQFQEVVNVGERLTTGERTMAEVLIGTRAVVTLGPGTAAQILTVSDDQAVIQVNQGLVRVAAAPSRLGPQGLVTVQTPTGQVHTRGGIVRVLVDPPLGKAEQRQNGNAQPYRASYTPERLAAAASPRGEIVQVDEGLAEILGVGGKPMTLQAGQSVTLQAGQPGIIGEGTKQDLMRPSVVATLPHSQTPKEGRDYLVALQVNQATQLGKVITGAAETTGKGESDKKNDTKNVINGATGGVTLTSNSNLVSALFGNGSAANPAASTPQDRTGNGFGGSRNNALFDTSDLCKAAPFCTASVKGNDKNALLVFTRKDPVEPFLKKTLTFKDSDGEIREDVAGELCDSSCLADHKDFSTGKLHENVGYRLYNSTVPNASTIIGSQFRVDKELVLIGGSPNDGHGGIAPTETLIVRGVEFTNLARRVGTDGLHPTDRAPATIELFDPTPREIVVANSTFVVAKPSTFVATRDNDGAFGAFVGGTLGQYSNLPLPPSSSDPASDAIAIDELNSGGTSRVDGAITATTAKERPHIVLSGGVSLDQQTTASIGTTEATNNYYSADVTRKATLRSFGAAFTGSLLSVINGPNKDVTTSLTMQDRMLGVYDGTIVKTDGGNKALLSVLDAKLKGPGSSIPLIDIAAGKHFTLGSEIGADGSRTVTETPGSPPNVTVTSALVTRSTIPLPLDSALLEASAPFFALTSANPCTNTTACTTMTTTSHFADLAGKQAQSLNLGDALVALNASKLIISSGHLLNLNNATAAIGGYLFSLTNGSTLQLNSGSLFSLTNNSSLTLTGTAFGVFGDKASALTITNNLCSTGPCGDLVNSAGQEILLKGVPIRVAGSTQDLVLPNNFNVFAGNSAADVTISEHGALFDVDNTSTLTIGQTTVVKP